MKRDTIFYGAAVLLERGISFLAIPILTKSLSQDQYGVWTQIIVTVGLLVGVVLVGFHTAAVRFLAGAKEKDGLFHGMLAVVSLNACVVIGLAFLFAAPLGGIIFGDTQFARFVPLLSVLLASEAGFELLTAFLRARNQIRLLSVYYVVKNTGRIAILGVSVVLLQRGLSEAVIGIVVFQMLFNVAIYVRDILRRSRITLSFRGVLRREVLVFSLPLVAYGGIIWLNNFVDRYLILHLLDLKQVSIYVLAYSFASAVGILYSVLGFTLYPRMAEYWNRGDRMGAAAVLRRGLTWYSLFMLPAVVAVTFLSGPLTAILSTTAYVTDWWVVFWLVAGVGVFGVYQLCMSGVLLANKTLWGLKVAGVAAVSNVGLNLLLIPRIGIMGAAIATFASNLLLAVWTVRMVRQILPLAFSRRIFVGGVV